MMRVISLQRAPSADRMLFAATPPPAIALTMTMPTARRISTPRLCCRAAAPVSSDDVLFGRHYAHGTVLLRRARHCFNAQAHSGSDTQVGPQQAE